MRIRKNNETNAEPDNQRPVMLLGGRHASGPRPSSPLCTRVPRQGRAKPWPRAVQTRQSRRSRMAKRMAKSEIGGRLFSSTEKATAVREISARNAARSSETDARNFPEHAEPSPRLPLTSRVSRSRARDFIGEGGKVARRLCGTIRPRTALNLGPAERESPAASSGSRHIFRASRRRAAPAPEPIDAAI